MYILSGEHLNFSTKLSVLLQFECISLSSRPFLFFYRNKNCFFVPPLVVYFTSLEEYWPILVAHLPILWSIFPLYRNGAHFLAPLFYGMFSLCIRIMDFFAYLLGLEYFPSLLKFCAFLGLFSYGLVYHSVRIMSDFLLSLWIFSHSVVTSVHYPSKLRRFEVYWLHFDWQFEWRVRNSTIWLAHASQVYTVWPCIIHVTVVFVRSTFDITPVHEYTTFIWLAV